MYKRYTKKEKAIIVERYLNGEKISTLSKEASISRTSIYAWIKKQQNSTQNKRKVDFKYLHDLTIMHKRQKVIVEILQNSKVTPLSPLKEKFESVNAFIEKLKEYIYYYNNERISLKLKGMSPVKYRTHYHSI